jgi:hypothetical protein
MKTFLATAVLLVGSLSFANQGVRTYSITNPQFAMEHLSGQVIVGKVVLDYNKKSISLNASGSAKCNPGQACSHAMRELNVELPIVSLSKDSCGVVTVTASEDKRPVDGDLQTLTVEDASGITCQTFVKYVERATYYTAGNGIDGEVEATSTFDLVPVLLK